ncbi:MAG: Trk system potassium transporter TrkA [Clostridiales bacterium]|nr:Trk system potassium transporter TrkA [Clostridiales bacterium]
MRDRRKKEKAKARGLKIIIVGCGKVGSTLVERLSGDEHDITVIDRNPEKLQQITDRYDVYGIIGNGASLSVQQDADVEQADVFIAVTPSDELNLLCCVVAKRNGNCDVIARVRTPEYVEEADYLKEKMGLTMIINPDQQAAYAIARILFMPTALSVDIFAGGQADMIRIKLPEGNILTGRRIMDLDSDLLDAVLICAVERDGRVVIPDGSFVLQGGDVIAFVAQMRNARTFLNKTGFVTHRVRNTMLLGGGRCSYYLAQILLKAGVGVKIVERDDKRCSDLSLMFPRAVVINGDATNMELLDEAGIKNSESVVALTDIDEENILMSMHLKMVTDSKLVTKVNRITFRPVIENLDLGSVIFPEYLTAEAITAYVRTKAEQLHSDIETLVRLFSDQLEAIELYVGEDSKVAGMSLSEMDLKEHVIITCINRGGEIIIPRGHNKLMAGDTVVIATTQTDIGKIDDVLI